MSSSRPTLVEYLQEKFLEPTIKNTCLTASKEALAGSPSNPSMQFRLFDKFPCLMPDEDYIPLKTEYLRLISNIKDIEHSSQGIFLRSEKDQENIESWIKKLIKTGYHYLIDENGQIRSDLLELLNLSDYKGKLTPAIVLAAYVGALSSEIILDNSEKSLAVCHFINKNYGKWVTNEYEGFHHKLDVITRKLIEGWHAIDLGYYPREKPLATIAVSTALFGLFGLAAAVFATSNSGRSASVPKHEPGPGRMSKAE